MRRGWIFALALLGGCYADAEAYAWSWIHNTPSDQLPHTIPELVAHAKSTIRRNGYSLTYVDEVSGPLVAKTVEKTNQVFVEHGEMEVSPHIILQHEAIHTRQQVRDPFHSHLAPQEAARELVALRQNVLTLIAIGATKQRVEDYVDYSDEHARTLDHYFDFSRDLLHEPIEIYYVDGETYPIFWEGP